MSIELEEEREASGEGAERAESGREEVEQEEEEDGRLVLGR